MYFRLDISESMVVSGSLDRWYRRYIYIYNPTIAGTISTTIDVPWEALRLNHHLDGRQTEILPLGSHDIDHHDLGGKIPDYGIHDVWHIYLHLMVGFNGKLWDM